MVKCTGCGQDLTGRSHHLVDRMVSKPGRPDSELLCTPCYNVERAEDGLPPIQEVLPELFGEEE